MKVVLSTIGKFHTFDLARELERHGVLERIYSGYPRFKLKQEHLPANKVSTFPYLQAPYMASAGWGFVRPGLRRAWEFLARRTLDAHVARRMPACDVFMGLSSSALLSGRAAQRAGAKFICDRGSTHIRVQDDLLRAEHERWGQPYEGIDPRTIDDEEAEYALADRITVPSTFTFNTFVQQGISPEKLRRLPYGVNLERFQPDGQPDPSRFDVLFVGGMSLRKGVPYLLQAYRDLQHPRKSLTFAGAVSSEVIALLRKNSLWDDAARLLGHVPQGDLKRLMSRSHALVLPSVEEGLALVQAQAMACGCVVVASTHTGAADLFTDGLEGFIVPIRDAAALADRLQRLADSPELRQQMSTRALQHLQGVGGWQQYGQRALATFQELLA